MDTDARITLQDVSFTYEEAPSPALSEISAVVRPGEFVAVLGHNGSGKSTLAKLVNALYTPSDGNVVVCGYDTREEKYVWEIRRRAGMIFQNPDNQIVAKQVYGFRTPYAFRRSEAACSHSRYPGYGTLRHHCG